MNDFRTELYRRYVSAFKTEQLERDEGARSAYLAWCRRKFLPLIDTVDRDEPVLELGCGHGRILELLRDAGFTKAEGIDISEEQVRLVRERDLKATVADVFEYLEMSDRYGAVIAIDLIEHFTKDELVRLLPKIHRALKPGGFFLLQTPNGRGLFPHQVIYGDVTHLTILTPESLPQLFRVAGFDEFTFREAGPVARNVKGVVRSVLWRLIKFAANAVRLIEAGKSQSIWTENMICRCRAGTKSEPQASED